MVCGCEVPVGVGLPVPTSCVVVSGATVVASANQDIRMINRIGLHCIQGMAINGDLSKKTNKQLAIVDYRHLDTEAL